MVFRNGSQAGGVELGELQDSPALAFVAHCGPCALSANSEHTIGGEMNMARIGQYRSSELPDWLPGSCRSTALDMTRVIYLTRNADCGCATQVDLLGYM